MFRFLSASFSGTRDDPKTSQAPEPAAASSVIPTTTGTEYPVRTDDTERLGAEDISRPSESGSEETPVSRSNGKPKPSQD